MARSTKSAPKGRKITVGFAGSGDISQDAVTDLLNDWLEVDGTKTANKILTFFPVGDKFNNENLEKVLSWGEEAELPFYLFAEDEDDLPDWASEGEGKSVTKDAAADLVKVLAVEAEAGNEAYLVLLLGDPEADEVDEISEHLIELATSAQIPIKDLNSALDDVRFKEDEAVPAEEETPEPEPEPEPEAPKTRGRARAKKAEAAPLEDEETSLDDEETKPEPEAEEPAPEAKKATERAVKEILSPEPSATQSTEQSPLEQAVRQIVLAVLEEQGLLKPEKKTAFYVDADGVHFRAGRGRPPKGLKKVELTDYELNVVRAKGLIDGE